jgi:dTDP-4-dehydrorhamnose reductase
MTEGIWLIGSKGMLGTELSLLLEKNGFRFIGTDKELDITDAAALEAFVKNKSPFGWIINCAAYTAVDKAEDDAEACRRLNVTGPANIAASDQKTGARLIHISTDYVFNGNGTQPYREDDPTDPIGIYGLTKRDGELAVLENNPQTYIIRTAWLYGIYGGNFVKTMLRLMNERGEVSVVNDQRGSPTWAYNLASVMVDFIRIIGSGKTVPFGIYHYTNEGNITWFDFAGEIYRQGRELGLVAKDCAIRPCASAEYPARVKRPAYSVLDKAKIKAALGIDIPAWAESLREYLRGSVNALA